ncbi:glucose/mannose transport system substrate-binding protein [Deinobacterium chartae]|uniref:Probable sugar-binding periplasmic protein n=1 Tax=Deinobacterium chartae TaxID=521158 RepID=A0A841I1H5_9DEIO|nr:ABC transporter substrate-binding protein [Deinobacterium chartae]MBB6097805.1 glucose/mannose transport system substrate-binding protein [Deinobacterium chartae]
MKKRTTLAATALGLVTLGLVAQAANATGKLEIFSWWTAGGEADGLKAIYGVIQKDNPKLEIINATVGGGAGTNAKAVLKTRMLGGNPPDSFQVHGGAELIDQWVRGRLMADISDVWKSQGWEKVIPKDLQEMVQSGGKYYAVPVNVHRGNVLYYNKAVLDKAGVKPPKTMAEFFAAAEKLKKAGVTPLALGSQGNWQITMLFENNLVAAGGPKFYRDLVTGKVAWTDAKVKKALEDTKRMLSYTNKDSTALGWDQAAGLVLNGKAAFTIMGDWAKGYFQANKWTADKEFSSVPAPGTTGSFMIITDTFGLPAKAKNVANGKVWLEALGSKAGQEAFNVKKGSICARTDCNPKLFDPIGQRTMKDFAKDQLVPSIAHGSAVKESFASAINDEMGVFLQKGDVNATATRLEQQAKSLGAR